MKYEMRRWENLVFVFWKLTCENDANVKIEMIDEFEI